MCTRSSAGSSCRVGRVFVPEARLKIAQHFSAGWRGSENAIVPLGTAERHNVERQSWCCVSHTYASSLFHCVWSTKERRPLITRELQDRLWAYLGGIAKQNDMKALAIGGVEDHVHVLL